MPTLDLETKDKGQEIIKAYLEQNASSALADKINNGVEIEKDGKRLVNKKTLDGFMRFACDEAKKQAAKGVDSACVEDAVVYGWAIHYFEENSIVGKLYNPDGSEYKPPAPIKTVVATPPKPVTPPKTKEPTLFDMIAAADKDSENEPEEQDLDDECVEQEGAESEREINDPSIDEITDELQRAIDEKQRPPQKSKDPIETYKDYATRYPDRVVAMRLGDFYEILGKKAELVAKELDLTLTSRRLSDTERVPMCGFPYHVKDKYIARLRKTRPVIVIDGDSVEKIDGIPFEDIIDGSYDDLTEEEMRQFDGDIQEPKEDASEPSSLTADDICFDTNVLKRLHEIFGDVLA